MASAAAAPLSHSTTLTSSAAQKGRR
uniref:Uncharacterized protein n=1 Tax=Arundo donax TaxID=35708 RepID=A0A0A9GRA9_ARUDO